MNFVKCIIYLIRQSITAYNKMRNATDEFEMSSYFGGFIDTPYLMLNTDAHKSNFSSVKQLVDDCIGSGMTFDRENPATGKGRYIIRDIPKYNIIEFLKKLKISRFSSKFDIKQICTFLAGCNDSSIDYFDIAFIEGKTQSGDGLKAEIGGKQICTVLRNFCKLDSQTDRLGVGRRGKLTGTSDGKAGIIDFNGRKADEIIQSANLHSMCIGAVPPMRYFRRKYRKPSASESKLTKIQVEIARSDFHRPGILV